MHTVQSQTDRIPMEIGEPRRIAWVKPAVKKHLKRWWVIDESARRVSGYETRLNDAVKMAKFLDDPDPAWIQELPTKF